MSEIMVLRTQIMGKLDFHSDLLHNADAETDNMEMLNYPDLQLCHFVLTFDENYEYDEEIWYVFLDKPARVSYDSGQPSTDRGYDDIKIVGKGDSPESAYRDLLKLTADELHIAYRDNKA
ncbi:hypothetical protein KCU78_g4180, partial [Aureobasidium melanogenum]